MRSLASLLTIVASLMTIGAVLVRNWWSQPRRSDIQDSDRWGTEPPPPPRREVPPWLRKLAKVWLYVVTIGLTTAAIVLVMVLVARIISISH